MDDTKKIVTCDVWIKSGPKRGTKCQNKARYTYMMANFCGTHCPATKAQRCPWKKRAAVLTLLLIAKHFRESNLLNKDVLNLITRAVFESEWTGC